MKKFLLWVLISAAAAGVPGAAGAAEKSFFIGREGLFAGDGTPGGFAGVAMGDASFAYARTSLQLPEDFRENSAAFIRFHFITSGTACTLEIRAYSVERLRVGKAIETVLGESSGFTPAIAGLTTTPATANTAFFKDFRLAKPTAGAYAGSQQAGDWIGLTIARVGPADSCTSKLILKGATVSYKTP
jgi:hypothetical protein